MSPQKAEQQKEQRRVKRHGDRGARDAGGGGGLSPERRRAESRRSRAKGAPGEGDSHKVRLRHSELQVINASGSRSLTDAPHPLLKVCVCGKEREIPAMGGPKMVETQTHLDMAKMDR